MTGEARFDGDPEEVERVARYWWITMQGTPSEADRYRFADWCDADPSRRAAYNRQQYLWDQGELLARTKFGPTRGLRRGSLFDRRPAVAWASTAAAAALLIAGTLVAVPRSLISPPPPAQAIAVYKSPAMELRTIRLAEGSSVTLDSGSRLRVAFAPAQRRLWLDAGRARFDVVHDARRPFVVSADGATVTARGTVFDVDVTAKDARVVLLRGSVEIRRTVEPTRAALILIAGQQVVIGRAGPLETLPAASRIDLRWPSGMMALDSTPLVEAVAEINRHNRVRIVLADPGMGAWRISGAFRTNDPGAFASAAAAMFDLEVDRGVKELLVLKAKASPAANRK